MDKIKIVGARDATFAQLNNAYAQALQLFERAWAMLENEPAESDFWLTARNPTEALVAMIRREHLS